MWCAQAVPGANSEAAELELAEGEEVSAEPLAKKPRREGTQVRPLVACVHAQALAPRHMEVVSMTAAAAAQEGKGGKPRVPLSDEATLAQLADIQGGCCVCVLRCAPPCTERAYSRLR